jgi:uncharacterized protein with von Willebrand factor type A (vWA) domain
VEQRILEFGALLRHHGLRISPAETLDSLEALRHTGVGTRGLLKDTLRATMVKRAVDLPTFEELFDLFFAALGDAIRDTADAAAKSLAGSLAEYQELLDRIRELLEQRQSEEQLSELARALLQQDDGTLERRLREAAQSVRDRQGRPGAFQQGRFGHSLAEELGLGDLTRELETGPTSSEGRGSIPRRSRSCASSSGSVSPISRISSSAPRASKVTSRRPSRVTQAAWGISPRRASTT